MGAERIILRIFLYMAFAASLAMAFIHGGHSAVCAVVALAGLACSAK